MFCPASERARRVVAERPRHIRLDKYERARHASVCRVRAERNISKYRRAYRNGTAKYSDL